ncbi:MAG: response regulator [Chloroflexi bacterium]|nr:response regulator [Chloroflexota bacterium]
MDGYSRILIVDDEPEFTRNLQAILEPRYQIALADSRSQAETTVRTRKPDLVVLGTIVPRGDAFRFHQWLRQMPRFSDVPLLVINARPEEQLLKGWRKDEGMRCEAEDFLTKPVDPMALLLRIEKLLDRVTRRIKVLIADDHGMVRDGMRAVLAVQRDMVVVGDAVNGKEALEKTLQLSPDVVLMDIVMPVMNGLDATKEICRACPQAKVLMLSQYDDDANIQASRHLGAMGFIPKAAASTLLINGIRTVSQGKQFTYTSVN